METPRYKPAHRGTKYAIRWFVFFVACGGTVLERMAWAQDRESLSGEKAAQALKETAQAEAEQYNIRYGPLNLRTGARVRVGYTDNVFYTELDRKNDFVIMPEVNLGAFMQISEINALRLSLGVGYEYYVKNS